MFFLSSYIPKLVSFCTLSFLLFLSPTVIQAQSESPARVVFSAFRNGQWDIYSVSSRGGDLRQLTDDPFEDEHPAYSPDGQSIAYASRRAQNWDIYLLDLSTGLETRLTQDPHYDGAPAWSQDGQWLAFESFRAGDLDIWAVSLDTLSFINYTSTSPTGDFDPAWDQLNNRILFTSWREGDNDIWAIDIETQVVSPLTISTASEHQPTRQGDTGPLVFTRNQLGDSDIYALNSQLSNDDEQLTWLGSLTNSEFSTDGLALFGLYHAYNGTRIIRLDKENPVPVILTENANLGEGLSWHSAPINSGVPVDSLMSNDFSRLYTEIVRPSTSGDGEPYDLIRLNDLSTASPWLADTVDDSYQALRFTLRDEIGYDFLGEVSETWRPISFFSETSQYSSWHKTGRAFDTLFDWSEQRLKIVRENIGGETYWRIMLRCEDQTGRCGRPIKARPWDYSSHARVTLGPGQGGVEARHLSGYYVDFTTLTQLYGWIRIASFDDEDFGWTWHFKAFEYWHFQKTLEGNNGIRNWYQALLDVYPAFKVEALFSWDQMREAGEDTYLIAIKGVPLPNKAERWWQTLTP
ncbi:MAG: hypothetical protein AAF629_36910 [Chloroflexota bacterium]